MLVQHIKVILQYLTLVLQRHPVQLGQVELVGKLVEPEQQVHRMNIFMWRQVIQPCLMVV